ncbi:hypothetical protein ACR6C2_25355 [Streptomyces sp. INA 01156]
MSRPARGRGAGRSRAPRGRGPGAGCRGGGGRHPAGPPARSPGGAGRPAEQRFLEEAERRGGTAARSGALDPLVLQGDDRLPYFAELASLRDRVIRGIGEEAHRAEEQARLDDAHALAEAARRAEVELIDRELARTDEQIATTTRQLDLLAMRSTRWNRFRDSLRERVERRALEGRDGQTPQHRDPDGDTADGDTADGEVSGARGPRTPVTSSG